MRTVGVTRLRPRGIVPDRERSAEILACARATFRREGAAVSQLAQRLDRSYSDAVDVILATKGQVIVSGMGKSGLIGRKISATFTSTGTRSSFLHPADALHGDLGIVTSSDVALLLSNSGNTSELRRLVPLLRRNGIPLVAMLGNLESRLCSEVDYVLDASVSGESCPNNLAPTTSTLAALAMGDALAVSLMRAREFGSDDFAKLHPGGFLGRRLLASVGDVMRTDDLPLLSPRQSIGESLITMTKGRLGMGIVVSDEHRGKVLGVITDGDLRRAMQASGRILNEDVTEIMTPDPITVSPALMFGEAHRRMRELKLQTLLVVDDQQSLIGVVDFFDD
jgi:arabinose-5-phosphate isomerase